MLKAVNPHDPITAARLVELLAPTTPWNRSLWSLNIVLTLNEILEAAEASRAGILGEDSLKRLGSLAIRLVGKDPGVLDEEKRVRNDALRTSPRFDGLAYHTFDNWWDASRPITCCGGPRPCPPIHLWRRSGPQGASQPTS